MNFIKKIALLALYMSFVAQQVKSQQKVEFAKAPKNLKINQIQVLGTHNSYAQPVDPAVLVYGDSLISKMMGNYMSTMPKEQQEMFKEYHPNGMSMIEGLKYDHPPFPDQLNAGLRNLEIDVYYDPTGGRFSDPASYRLFKSKGLTNLAPFNKEGLDEPGFKVLHIADFDFRTHYPTLKAALKALKVWSDANPGHIPIFIQLEAKDSGIPIFPNPAQVLKFDEKAFDELDAEIVRELGKDKLITPDQVRGNYATLKEAVLAKNWPTVNDSRGKFIFLMLPSAGGGAGAASPYVKNRPNLEKRVMFIQSTPKDDFAAFFLLDNSIIRQEEIKKYVAMGYMVRTRSDIETYEAKVNDYTRAKAAFSSGAQIISTDFYKRGNGYGTGYVVQLPGKEVALINPVNGKQL